jgi:hypothetical protein
MRRKHIPFKATLTIPPAVLSTRICWVSTYIQEDGYKIVVVFKDKPAKDEEDLYVIVAANVVGRFALDEFNLWFGTNLTAEEPVLRECRECELTTVWGARSNLCVIPVLIPVA